jgi:hypothetical protein
LPEQEEKIYMIFDEPMMDAPEEGGEEAATPEEGTSTEGGEEAAEGTEEGAM